MQDVSPTKADQHHEHHHLGLDFKSPFKFFMSKEITSRTCGIPHVDSMELLIKKQHPVPPVKVIAAAPAREKSC
jgi:hypothetical protein